MSYREAPTPVPGAVAWAHDGDPSGTTILPDGCLTAAAPARALAEWAGPVLAAAPDEPFGSRVFAAAAAGTTVAAIADALGVTPRTLHRRCLPVFGYGAQHLRRVLRLQRALAAARTGTGWADVAAGAGYADQAHLARDARALAGTTPTGLLER